LRPPDFTSGKQRPRDTANRVVTPGSLIIQHANAITLYWSSALGIDSQPARGRSIRAPRAFPIGLFHDVAASIELV
jgi:hypothetical protein